MKHAYYFISDAHLGLGDKTEEKFKESILVSFLDDIKEDAKELYIVGDLFDFWIEYKYVVPKGFYRFFAKLSELMDNGLKVYYLAGNHDFWRGNYFKDEFGIDILDEPFERVIEGKRFFIHHGDGLAYNDTGYKIVRAILRNKVCQFLYSLLHPTIGIGLAKGTSSKSRVHTSKKDYSQKDGLRDFAKEKIREGYNYVLMGHRHNPEMLSEGSGWYINLGDWMDNFTFGVFADGSFSLKRYYDIEKHETTNEVIKSDWQKESEIKEKSSTDIYQTETTEKRK
ncbi:MAG: UDP-2,3-diacylglucosamine diphosphatase [Ignavibacteriae bacterium]|nr:UDP-2,3-diacylglucosamine diphosphatase [Ignavibacteriota bacterium]